CQHYYTSTF
nr:immunoglobulin light chain junction region [Macaca mulatta]